MLMFAVEAAKERNPSWVLDDGMEQVIRDLCEEIDADPLFAECDATASANERGDVELVLTDRYGDHLESWIFEGAFAVERDTTETDR